MKQKFAMILAVVFLTLNLQAENVQQSRKALIEQTCQNIAELSASLEISSNSDEEYAIRLQIRELFKKLDQLVLSSPLFKTSEE